MSNPGDYKNNPLYTDITKLDHLSPQPTFSYNWNKESGRWEPAGQISVDLSSLSGLSLDGVSGLSLEGLSGISSEDTKTHELLSGTNSLLSGLSTEDIRTHELLSGISGILEAQESDTVNVNRADMQPWKLRSKTVNQKIEEDFILMEDIPDHIRYGTPYEKCYGENISIMDEVNGNYFQNARLNGHSPETGHPDYFLHAEYINTGRCVESFATFHSDTLYALRQENPRASAINSYELKDFTELYELGLVNEVQIYNESPYALQFHTIDKTFDENKTYDQENNNLLYLFPDTAVRINNDEAKRIFVKRPHTISGYTAKYSLTYKVTGLSDVNTY
jgi:hypothetical protein